MNSRVVAIGVFDGVHIGHQELIRQAKISATSREIALTALTFDPHPMNIVKDISVEHIATLNQRKTWLRFLGVDDVYVCEFTRERSMQSAEEFVESVLISELQADVVVVGEGFRFGHKALGTASTFRNYGVEVLEVPHTLYGDARVSSTRIRSVVMSGDMDAAAKMLGRNFEVEATVVEGFRRGRELGFPTANVNYESSLVLPRDGVYAGYLRAEAHSWPAAISIGYNSTFQAEKRTLEVYALTEQWLDLYDKSVQVEFVDFIRPMRTYGGADSLIEAIEADVLSVKNALNLG